MTTKENHYRDTSLHNHSSSNSNESETSQLISTLAQNNERVILIKMLINKGSCGPPTIAYNARQSNSH